MSSAKWRQICLVLIVLSFREIRWNMYQNKTIICQENSFENLFKMASILSRPRFVSVFLAAILWEVVHSPLEPIPNAGQSNLASDGTDIIFTIN